jgi:hypothetical protein
MAYTGYKRSLSATITRLVNGSPDTGYPKTYPTATDISNGYFTYDSIQYSIPTSIQLAEMEQSEYDALVANFKLYVLENETIDFDTEFSNSNQEQDLVTCSDTNITGSIIGVWDFEGTTGDALDSHATHHGTVSGGVTRGVNTSPSVAMGNCFEFNGVDGKVVIPSVSGMWPLDFTIAGWVFIPSLTVATTIFGIIMGPGGAGTTRGWRLTHDKYGSGSGGRIRFSSGNNGVANTTLSAENLASEYGAWMHFALSHQNGVSTKFFINGTQRNSAVITLSYEVDPTLWSMNFGYVNGTEYFLGKLDGIAYFGEAFTLAQAQHHMNTDGRPYASY